MSHVLTVIDNHSVAVDLLRPRGYVLDAGARGFVFSRYFANTFKQVAALDPDPEIEDPKIPGVHLDRLALASKDGESFLEMLPDENARRITGIAGGEHRTVPIKTVSLETVTAMHFVDKWDLIKLNVEGAEYDILDGIKGVVAKQIVFSFHEHTDRRRGKNECDRIINHVRLWYDIYNRDWEKRYGCDFNYWDVLAIERGLTSCGPS